MPSGLFANIGKHQILKKYKKKTQRRVFDVILQGYAKFVLNR